jgi:hypothetical protein
MHAEENHGLEAVPCAVGAIQAKGQLYRDLFVFYLLF